MHDGYIQIGIMKHSVEKHMELNPTVNWIVNLLVSGHIC